MSVAWPFVQDGSADQKGSKVGEPGAPRGSASLSTPGRPGIGGRCSILSYLTRRDCTREGKKVSWPRQGLTPRDHRLLFYLMNSLRSSSNSSQEPFDALRAMSTTSSNIELNFTRRSWDAISAPIWLVKDSEVDLG